MYFGLSEEQNQFQDYVKKFLSDNVSVDEIRKIAIFRISSTDTLSDKNFFT